MGRQAAGDAWSRVTDLDGQDHYRTLGLAPHARLVDIKKAYRQLARRLHPDKPGGDAVGFGRLQIAYETLSDPCKRAVYDDFAKDLQYRYVEGWTHKTPGSEGVLLDQLNSLGLQCDPRTQLVVLCEVCRRPSTKECWTCGMKICDFCTLKRHWKDQFPLHWPLINSDHMRTRLAKQELEKKRIEDDQTYLQASPNFRNDAELQDIRRFKEAAAKMLDRNDRLVTYDLALARFYMWAQTDKHVYIAVNVPTGYEDKELMVDCTELGLRVQPHSSPPVIERAFAYGTDTSRPIDTFRTKDNRLLAIAVPKGVPGQCWRRLFQGDSDGARCLQPPYSLREADDSVILEMQLPFWTDADDDVHVVMQPHGLSVSIGQTMSIQRTCWSYSLQAPSATQAAIDPEESVWSLDDDVDCCNERIKMLMISIARPPLTDSEKIYKRGKRQDNSSRERRGMHNVKGVRFFADDEDEFGLEDILQALCIWEAGSTFVPAKPWQPGSCNSTVRDVHLLSSEVQGHLQRLLDEEEWACQNEKHTR